MAMGNPDDRLSGRQFCDSILDCGDWTWAGGWLYVALQVVNTILTYCMLFVDRPDLLIRRQSMGEGTPTWDKVLAPMMAFSTLIISLVSAVGIRFSDEMAVPAWLLLVAFPVHDHRTYPHHPVHAPK